MDPDEALSAIRTAVATIQRLQDTADEYPSYEWLQAYINATAIIVGDFDNLDTWITTGGFLPADWSK